MTIFTLWFENFPNNLPALVLSAGVAVLFIVIFARAAMSDGVALRRLTPAEDAGLERLFFELTTSGEGTPSTRTDSIHLEPRGATA